MRHTSTHTYALLPVTQPTFDEIRLKLEAAGYQDQVHEERARVTVDMHGLALVVDDKIPHPPEPPSLFTTGDFTLRSGRKSRYKIECDAMTAKDWEAAAVMAATLLHKRKVLFGEVFGVPRGGVPFAAAMRKHVIPGHPGKLVCEDVWTTGGSVVRFIDKTWPEGERECAVIALFARGKMELPWVHAVFPLPYELWDE